MPQKIKDIIKKKGYPEVILIFGQEDFLIDKAADYLINSLIESGETDRNDIDVFDGAEADINAIVSSCGSFPFVSKRRAAIVNNFDKLYPRKVSKKAKEKSPFAKYLKSPQPTTTLILKKARSTIKDSHRKKSGFKKAVNSADFPYKDIIEKYEWIEYPRIYENQFPAWTIKTFESKGKTIEKEAAEILVSNVNPNLRELNNEIEKILLYVEDKKNVVSEDVLFITGSKREFNVFELQRAVGSRNLASALSILENILSADRKEILILTTLINYFSVLLKLVEAAGKASNRFELAKIIGVPPFFVQEYLNALKIYTPKEIENAFSALTEADYSLKTSSADRFYVMENMLIKIIER